MTLQGAFRLWLLDILFPFPQSISPGLVRTEFLGRASNAKDLEQSKKYYDKICAEVHHNYTLLLNFNSKLHCTVSVVFTDCIYTGVGSRRYCKCNTVYPVHTSKNAGIIAVFTPSLV